MPTPYVSLPSWGVAIILAASASPNLFDRVVLIEPVIPSLGDLDGRNSSRRTTYRARRRRSSFPSHNTFFDYFRSRHRYRLWINETLWLHAFYRTYVDSDDMVRRKCPPHIEARIIENTRSVDVWAAFNKIRCPTLLMTSSGWTTKVVEEVMDAMNDITHVEVAGTTRFLTMEQPKALG